MGNLFLFSDLSDYFAVVVCRAERGRIVGMVCDNALGMKIDRDEIEMWIMDKPECRAVVHAKLVAAENVWTWYLENK